ncbi:hypothetical protein G9A89_023427 [Geosiphon pyriformis]|nr:hypothetical protein G9A89_023427 [Geosiphon pyriformis]
MPYCTPNRKVAKDSLGVICDISLQTIEKKEGIVIYFRGPELTRKQWNDRKFNLDSDRKKDSWPVDSQWNEVTDGAVEGVLNGIKYYSSEFTGDTVFTYFTGHGIGGVYAQYIANILATMSERKRVGKHLDGKNMEITVVTFGQPRAGNFQYAERVNALMRSKFLKIYRVTHSNDHVPQRPYLKSTSKPWFHTDREYWISLNCNCSQKKAPEYELFECPGYSKADSEKYGENKECNLGTDGASNTANYGPYFGITFGKCDGFFPLNYRQAFLKLMRPIVAHINVFYEVYSIGYGAGAG